MTILQEKNIPNNQSSQPIHSADLISIAPMLDWTDRHFRYFLRHICHHAMFYSEMIAASALILGDRKKLLAYHSSEHPIVLQVGGCDPKLMAVCATYAQDWGYKGININAGCPSSRVQSGKFGAVLMQTPQLVADCVAEMVSKVKIPVTVKTRISLNTVSGNGFEELFRFADLVHQAGCHHLIVHARQAKLNWSPKDNRDKLPLNYDIVYALKKSFPDMFISINGNILSIQAISEHLQHVDGAMIGRFAYGNPYALSDIDNLFWHDSHPILTRVEILEYMLPYIENFTGPKHHITHHMMGLYHGEPNAKIYKQIMAAGDIESLKQFIKNQHQ